MVKENRRQFLYIALFFAAISYLFYRYVIMTDVSDIHIEIWIPLAFTVIVSSIVGLYEIFATHGKHFWTKILCTLFIPNKIVYVSLSYLLRIKVHGTERYLLVRGSKINQYQPVGGVYKLVGNKNIEKDWKASIKPDTENPHDLRFFIKAKYLPDVLKWFKSGKDREIGVWREFYEELVGNDILTTENFKSVRAEYLYTKEKLLSKETRFNNETYHTLAYEIFNVELDERQLVEFKRLQQQKMFTKKYAFVTEDEINKECFNNDKTRIGQHTKHII